MSAHTLALVIGFVALGLICMMVVLVMVRRPRRYWYRRAYGGGHDARLRVNVMADPDLAENNDGR